LRSVSNGMKGYITNIEKETKKNNNFRKVLYTAPNSQLVVMSIKPGEEIGEEVHKLDQFIRVEEGKCTAVLNNVEQDIEEDCAVVVPAGTKHNFINISKDKDLKIYTIYSPPEHRDGVIHPTKADAMSDDEHFDGKTTETD